jgi:hypothetical protein
LDRGPDNLGVFRVQSAAERIHRPGKLLGRVPQDFSETIREKDGVREQIPVPEAVGGTCQGQKIALFTGAQGRFRPAVSRPLYEQPDDQQGYDGAKSSEGDDMPWVKHQKYLLRKDWL